MRICNACKVEKPLEEAFYRDRTKPLGYQYTCKQCQADRAKTYYRNNKETYKERYTKHQDRYEKSRRLRRYGLTEDEFESLLQTANGQCQACGEPAKLCVDHCHESGKVRGLLCHKCNTALGLLDDSPQKIYNLLQYLKPG